MEELQARVGWVFSRAGSLIFDALCSLVLSLLKMLIFNAIVRREFKSEQDD